MTSCQHINLWLIILFLKRKNRFLLYFIYLPLYGNWTFLNEKNMLHTCNGKNKWKKLKLYQWTPYNNKTCDFIIEIWGTFLHLTHWIVSPLVCHQQQRNKKYVYMERIFCEMEKHQKGNCWSLRTMESN